MLNFIEEFGTSKRVILQCQLLEKKLLDFLLLFNSDQTRNKVSFLRRKKIKKKSKVTWLKNHTD